MPRPTRWHGRLWLLVAAAAVFIALEPAWFLRAAALGLCALALFWIFLLARLLGAGTLGGTARRPPGAPRRGGPAAA